jgi:beta-glucosidase
MMLQAVVLGLVLPGIMRAQTAPATAIGAQTDARTQTAQPWFNPSLPTTQRVDALVHAMTLEEKVAQMMNAAPAIPRLGVPAYNYWSEGLHGIARSGYATLFPQAIGLAATWDPALQQQVGDVISTEARAKYNDAIQHGLHSIYFGLGIWSPNINIVRDPRWGRGLETYGEDPYLTGTMAVAFIRGLQGNDPKYLRTIATPKHFDAYSGPEPMRHMFNAQVSAHDLEDTYTPAFRAAIMQGKAASLMCSYNAVNGTPACANTLLLQRYLRQSWGFAGFVTSDCGAISDFYRQGGHGFSPDAAHASAAAVKAGTELDCGDAYRALTEAVRKGLISEAQIDAAVRALFLSRMRLGMFDPAGSVRYDSTPYSTVDSPEHRALSLRAAQESIVLLKNDGVLPLNPHLKTIAVIGPNAASLPGIEGNYHAIPSHPSLPLDGLKQVLRGHARVLYAQGSNYADDLPIVLPRSALHTAAHNGRQGLTAEYFANAEFTGKPAVTRVDPQVEFDWNAASPVAPLPRTGFSVRWTGVFVPPAAGKYSLRLRTGCGDCGGKVTARLWLDGKEIAASAGKRGGPQAEMTLDNTRPHAIRIEYSFAAPLFGAGITLEWQAPADVLREQAVQAAKRADAVIAFVGLSPRLEGEEMPLHVQGFSGGDRTNIDLPAVQQDLLHALGATGKPLVVVLMSGSAVAVNWASQHAGALLEAWYPGEAGGEGIADVLTGAVNPSGRLPLTFYKSDAQLPPFTDYSMKERTYRYFTGTPLYPFGYGLSYSKFAYSNLKLDSSAIPARQPLSAHVTVTNDSKTAGDEVVQLYLIPPSGQGYPLRQLIAFQRVHVAAHASRTVNFSVPPRMLSEVDAVGQRAIRAGTYRLFAGGQSPDNSGATPGETASFTISGMQPVSK